MKRREGFVLVLVLCITSVLSFLLLQAYRRSSLLLRSVVEREQIVKQRNGLDTLMQYALYMAKYNWDFLLRQTRKGGISQHSFDWEVEPEKKLAATCLYTSAGENRLAVEAMLKQKAGLLLKITCEVILSPEGKIIVDAWKEEN